MRLIIRYTESHAYEVFADDYDEAVRNVLGTERDGYLREGMVRFGPVVTTVAFEETTP